MTELDEPPYDPAYDEPVEVAGAERAPARRGHLAAVPDDAPSHNTEAEEALIGAALLSANAADQLAQAVDHVYGPANRAIAEAVARLHTAGNPIDVITVANDLDAHQTLDAAGGQQRLLHLQIATPATSNADSYAAIIREHSTRRRMQAIGHEIALLASDHTRNPNLLAADAQTLLDEIHDATAAGNNTLRPVAETIGDYLDEIDARSSRDLAGIATGWNKLDRATAGLQDGRLYIVAGRPGMGKSDVAAVLALNTARAGHRTLVVSVEMATTELLDRWTSSASQLDVSTITAGRIGDADAGRFAAAITELSGIPLWIDDNPNATAASIRGAARRAKADLVIVDYLQLLGTPKAENRQAEVTRLAGDLKRIARDLEIPVIALAQLNRSAEMRVDKHPALADLRESGAIEQDADVVIGLYRDEYYHPNSESKGVLEMSLLKNRSGPQTTVKVAYLPATKTITDLAGEH